MERNLKEALRHRRSYYELAPQSPIDDVQIEEIVRFAVKHIPSAFNSQSARLVLLLHEHHKAFWELVKRTLQAIVPEKAFAATEKKIDGSFASGYRNSSRVTPTTSPSGPSTPRQCINWQYGPCSKTPGSGLRFNITIH